MKRLLSIWLHNWPIQRLQTEWRRDVASQPLPNNRSAPNPDSPTGPKPTGPKQVGPKPVGPKQVAPVMLWTSDPRRGRLVVACCAAARRFGVRPGIAIAQAAELASGAAVKPYTAEHDPIADWIALERIATGLQIKISPLVAIESLGPRLWAGQISLQPDSLFCDLSGVTHLFADEAGILRAARQCLCELGFVAKLAIADNAAAAWAHAHYNAADDFISTHLSDDLKPLSVNALRIETETKYSLDRLGIETIDALLRLPRGGLARRLGEGLVQRIAESLGEVPMVLDFHHAEHQHCATHALEYPTDDLEILLDRLNGLAKNILAGLSAIQRGALRLECRLDLVDGAQRTTQVGLFAPTLDLLHLHRMICSGLESLKIPAPITKVTLSVLQSEPLRTQQHSLFAAGGIAAEQASVCNPALAKLVDTLSNRLGRDAVLGVRRSDNPLPEKAFRTYPLTDHHTRRALRRTQRRLPGKPRSAASDQSQATLRVPGRDDARRRPLKLLRQPIPLAIAMPPGPPQPRTQPSVQPRTQPSVRERLPAFRCAGNLHRVAYYWGPERIETGWWDGPTIRRDYYRVETDTGYLWWIFRDLKTSQWYLHGRFT